MIPRPLPLRPRTATVAALGLWLWLLTTWLALAATAEPWRLSIQQAVELGLGRAYDIQISQSQARETRAQVTAAWADVLPDVNASLNYTRTLSPSTFTLPPGLDFGNLPFGQENSYDAGVSLVQPLYRPGAVRGIRIARQYYESAMDQATEMQLSTVLNICLAYYDAVLAEQLAGIARAQLDQFEAELKDIRLKRSAGDASDLDVSRAEVNRANIEPQLVEALNAQDSSMLLLRQLINVDVDVEFLLVDQLTTDGFQPISDDDLQGLTRLSAQHRAAVRASQRQIRIRTSEVKQARAAYLPSLNAVGNLGFQAYPDNAIPNQDEWDENWTVGVRVSVPIFDGGRRRAAVEAAKERVTQSSLQLDQLILAIRTEVENWRIRLKRSQSLIATRARASAEAERVYNLTGLSYRNGSATYLELTDARNNLRSARANEVRTLHDYFAAYLNLIRAVGVPPSAFAGVQSLNSHQAILPMNSTDSPGKGGVTP